MKPTVSYSYHLANSFPEYHSQINFGVSCKKNKWRVLTIIETSKEEQIYEGLHSANIHDSFAVTPKILSSNRISGLIFAAYAPNDTADDRRALLKFLHHEKLPIIWKEGLFGYEINVSGRIQRKWKLNTVYFNGKQTL